MDIIRFSCSVRAFNLHTQGMKCKKIDDNWWESKGWHELRSLEKLFPLDKYILKEVPNSKYRGISAASSEYDYCLEFIAETKHAPFLDRIL